MARVLVLLASLICCTAMAGKERARQEDRLLERFGLRPNQVADALVEKAEEEEDLQSKQRLWERCLSVAPERLECVRRLAIAYAKLAAASGDNAMTDEARSLYQKYVIIAPEGDPYVDRITKILRDDQEAARRPAPAYWTPTIEGRVTLEQCLARDPNDLTCVRRLAIIYAQLGDLDNDAALTDQAAALYEKYLRLAPSDDRYVSPIRKILDDYHQASPH